MIGLALLLVLPGCNRDDVDTGEEEFTPTLATGGCGAPAYDWAPLDRMGEVVDWEYLPEASLSATAIDTLLTELGSTAFSPVPYGAKVYRIRYLTQDRGEVIEATGLVSFPDLDEPTDVPSVLWTHGTTGFTDACAPSGQGIEGAAFNTVFAALGYAVAAPDYLGMNGWGEPAPFLHPYVVPEPTAVASLDSLRALWRFREDSGQAGIDARPTRQTVFWGGSEGGFAALWADRYVEGYAPEVDLVATVPLVPPTDVIGLGQHAVTVLGPTTAAFTALMATGNPWYGGAGVLSEVLTDEAPTYIASNLVDVLGAGCDDGDLFDEVDEITDVYQPDFVTALAGGDMESAEPWSCYLELATLRDTEIPRGHDAPVLFIVSGADDLVVAEIERADFPRLCDAGYRAEYIECEGADHAEGAVLTLPYQHQWIQDRLAGIPLPTEATCVQGAAVDCEEFGLLD